VTQELGEASRIGDMMLQRLRDWKYKYFFLAGLSLLAAATSFIGNSWGWVVWVLVTLLYVYMGIGDLRDSGKAKE
jgi:hypothetical protein